MSQITSTTLKIDSNLEKRYFYFQSMPLTDSYYLCYNFRLKKGWKDYTVKHFLKFNTHFYMEFYISVYYF